MRPQREPDASAFRLIPPGNVATPVEDWLHPLLNGEIYVSRRHEKYCLHCALRMGFVTDDRLFWQHGVPKKKDRAV